MKIRSITFTQRFNMGNYEHIEISAVAEVEEQESADSAMQALKTFVQTALNKKVEEKNGKANEELPTSSSNDVGDSKEAQTEEKNTPDKKTKKAKKEKSTPIAPSELPPVEPEGFVSEPVGKNVVVYNSNLAEHKSIFGGYLAKKYDNAWKTAKPVEEIKAFTASLNGKEFLDNDGKIVDSFLDLVHGFFGA